jgi:hypothetical protein
MCEGVRRTTRHSASHSRTGLCARTSRRTCVRSPAAAIADGAKLRHPGGTCARPGSVGAMARESRRASRCSHGAFAVSTPSPAPLMRSNCADKVVTSPLIRPHHSHFRHHGARGPASSAASRRRSSASRRRSSSNSSIRRLAIASCSRSTSIARTCACSCGRTDPFDCATHCAAACVAALAHRAPAPAPDRSLCSAHDVASLGDVRACVRRSLCTPGARPARDR